MFEEASRLKLRFSTTKGMVSVEDLWDLPLTRLNEMAKSLNKQIKSSDEEDFLDVSSTVDKTTKLKFDVVLHVLNTKKAENEAASNARKKKEEKERLLEILARKQEQSLEQLTEEELLAKLSSL